MIDKLISSDLAVLARDDLQRIPAFVVPQLRPKPARRALTWGFVGAAAPVVTMLVAGMVMSAFGHEWPLGYYAPFVPPFVVAIASLVGLAIGSRPLALNVRQRAQVGYLLTGAGLVIATAVCFYINWPRPDSLYLVPSDDTIYLSTWFAGSASCANPGFIVIAATLGALVARKIAGRLNPVAWRNRRLIDASSTSAIIICVLVVVAWTTTLDFEQRYWPLIHFNLPDLSYRNHIPEYIHAKMWHAITFRPWSTSMISPEQWNVAIADVVVIVVSLVTAVAIVREGKTGRSLWLRLMESPAVVPLFVLFGTANLARAMVSDGRPTAERAFAWAIIGVMLAFTSMILRRRRRREALS